MTHIIYPINAIKAALKREEGYEAHCYQDSMARWTIGHGRNIDPKGGIGITKDEAEYLLLNDIKRTIEECERAFPFLVSLDRDRLSVVIQLCFQLGLPSLRKFRKMLGAIERGKFTEASEELLDSKFARQVPERARRLSRQLKGKSDDSK
jgi:lysozyme